jgi:hypothetical protein
MSMQRDRGDDVVEHAPPARGSRVAAERVLLDIGCKRAPAIAS